MTEVFAAAAAASVSLTLVWLALHWRKVAARSPAGGRLYPRVMARAALAALVLWTVGLAMVTAGWFFLRSATPSGPPRLSPGPPPSAGPAPPSAAPAPSAAAPAPSSPAPAPPSAAVPSPSSAAAPASAETGSEFTEQPELPAAFAAVMAAAAAGGGSGGPGTQGPPVVLATGDVVISSVDPTAGEIDLLNRSGHSVDLSGWSLAVRSAAEPGAPHWYDLPDGLVLPPGGTFRVLTGKAARHPAALGEVTLYDSGGVVLARLPGPAACGGQ